MDIYGKYALVECYINSFADPAVFETHWIMDNFVQDEFNFDCQVTIDWPAENPKHPSKQFQGTILLINGNLYSGTYMPLLLPRLMVICSNSSFIQDHQHIKCNHV